MGRDGDDVGAELRGPIEDAPHVRARVFWTGIECAQRVVASAEPSVSKGL